MRLLIGGIPFSLAILLTVTRSSHAQDEPDWRWAPIIGYEASSGSAYIGVQLDRIRPRKGWPDRLGHEIAFVMADNRSLVYLDYQWNIASSRDGPIMLLGVGFGLGARGTSGLDGLFGASIHLEQVVSERIRISLGAKYIRATYEPQDIVPITLGISFPL